MGFLDRLGSLDGRIYLGLYISAVPGKEDAKTLRLHDDIQHGRTVEQPSREASGSRLQSHKCIFF